MMKRFLRVLLGLAILCTSFSASAGINTWTGIGPESDPISKVAFHPTQPDTLFALTFAPHQLSRATTRVTDAGCLSFAGPTHSVEVPSANR